MPRKLVYWKNISDYDTKEELEEQQKFIRLRNEVEKRKQKPEIIKMHVSRLANKKYRLTEIIDNTDNL